MEGASSVLSHQILSPPFLHPHCRSLKHVPQSIQKVMACLHIPNFSWTRKHSYLTFSLPCPKPFLPKMNFALSNQLREVEKRGSN